MTLHSSSSFEPASALIDGDVIAASHDANKQRLAVYAGLGFALSLYAVLIQSSSWRGSTGLHTVMEVMATLLASLVGIVALVRFYAHKDNNFLLIGVGFVGTAFLDGYHAVVTSSYFNVLLPSPPPSLIPWSWNASRIFLALLMVASLWAWRRERDLGESGRLPATVVYTGLIALTLALFCFFAFVPLPRAYYPELFLGRPEELVSGGLFALALVGYVRKGAWRNDPFEHALVCSLVMGVVSQVVVMARSFVLFDAMFDLAHLLKIISYVTVLAGLLAEMYSLFLRAYSAVETQAALNRELDAELTKRQQAQQRLEESNLELSRSNKELDDFAYIASHDLKEPLRGIHNYSTFLLEDYEDLLDQDGQDKLRTLTRLCQRMETLIDTLLHFSRAGRVDLAMVETDLDKVLDGVLDSLHVTLQADGIEIRRPVTLPSVVCDRARVGEIFRNLITNAMKFTDKDEKWIEIGVQAPPQGSETGSPGTPVLYVRDNGIGIREKHLEAIFRIFKRLHGRNKYGGGTGAGLTITKKIVERHGGEITVQSVHGEGTTFSFTLARSRDNPAGEQYDTSEQAADSGR